jgi:peptidoglycan/LPS O-acetylase OafA/YrhL
MRVHEGRRGGQLLAVTLIVGGALLLVFRLLGWRISDHFWPFFVIVPGLALLAVAATASGRESRSLAVGGAVVAGAGLILFVQSLTDYFQSWAYAWTLLPAFAGAALLFIGRRDSDAAGATVGLRLMQWGGATFVVFAVVFEGLIFNSGLVEGGLVLPIVLIAVGVFVLFRGGFITRGPDAKQGGSEGGGAAKGSPTVAQS